MSNFKVSKIKFFLKPSIFLLNYLLTSWMVRLNIFILHLRANLISPILLNSLINIHSLADLLRTLIVYEILILNKLWRKYILILIYIIVRSIGIPSFLVLLCKKKLFIILKEVVINLIELLLIFLKLFLLEMLSFLSIQIIIILIVLFLTLLWINKILVLILLVFQNIYEI